jgi:hypothetical protein
VHAHDDTLPCQVRLVARGEPNFRNATVHRNSQHHFASVLCAQHVRVGWSEMMCQPLEIGVMCVMCVICVMCVMCVMCAQQGRVDRSSAMMCTSFVIGVI